MIDKAWHEQRARDATITVLDFETTGAVAGWPIEPWQLGVVLLRGGRVVPETRTSWWLRVALDRPFNPQAPGRYRQVRALLATAPTFAEVWRQMMELGLLGRPLAAHNIGTERTILRRQAPLHRSGPWLDTLRLARRAYPGLREYGLGDLLAALNLQDAVRRLCPEGAPHDADYDACACAALLEHLLALPAWREVTLGALAT